MTKPIAVSVYEAASLTGLERGRFERDLAHQLEIVQIVPRPVGRPSLFYSLASIEKWRGKPFTVAELRAVTARYERRKSSRRKAAKRAKITTEFDPQPGQRA